MNKVFTAWLSGALMLGYALTLIVPKELWWYHWFFRWFGLIGFVLCGLFLKEVDKPWWVLSYSLVALSSYYTTLLWVPIVTFLKGDITTVDEVLTATGVLVIFGIYVFGWFFAICLGQVIKTGRNIFGD